MNTLTCIPLFLSFPLKMCAEKTTAFPPFSEVPVRSSMAASLGLWSSSRIATSRRTTASQVNSNSDVVALSWTYGVV